MKEMGIKTPEYLWTLLKVRFKMTLAKGIVKKVREGSDCQSVAEQVLGEIPFQLLKDLDKVSVYQGANSPKFEGSDTYIKYWYKHEFYHSIDLLESQTFVDCATCTPGVIADAMGDIGERGRVKRVQSQLQNMAVRLCCHQVCKKEMCMSDVFCVCSVCGMYAVCPLNPKNYALSPIQDRCVACSPARLQSWECICSAAYRMAARLASWETRVYHPRGPCKDTTRGWQRYLRLHAGACGRHATATAGLHRVGRPGTTSKRSSASHTTNL